MKSQVPVKSKSSKLVTGIVKVSSMLAKGSFPSVMFPLVMFPSVTGAHATKVRIIAAANKIVMIFS